MTTPVRVIAEVHVRPAHMREILPLLDSLATATRDEPGNIAYGVHIDADDPHHLLFFEEWASLEAFKGHLISSHLLAYGDASSPLLEGPARVVVAKPLNIQGAPA